MGHKCPILRQKQSRGGRNVRRSYIIYYNIEDDPAARRADDHATAAIIAIIIIIIVGLIYYYNITRTVGSQQRHHGPQVGTTTVATATPPASRSAFADAHPESLRPANAAARPSSGGDTVYIFKRVWVCIRDSARGKSGTAGRDTAATMARWPIKPAPASSSHPPRGAVARDQRRWKINEPRYLGKSSLLAAAAALSRVWDNTRVLYTRAKTIQNKTKSANRIIGNYT